MAEDIKAHYEDQLQQLKDELQRLNNDNKQLMEKHEVSGDYDDSHASPVTGVFVQYLKYRTSFMGKCGM